MHFRESKWTFSTSNSGGGSIGFFGGEGGSVTLRDPGGMDVKFAYGALGATIGKGVQLPKIGKMNTPGITGSSESFPSSGLVLLAPSFRGSELTVQDICGACTFLEVSGGVAWGEAAYAMTFGINPALFAAYPVVPAAAIQWIMKSVKGYLLFRGMNYGLQAGGSLGSYVGYMRTIS
jgi:hypothetical protein